MSPTIKDLAAELGIHKATVSRALSGKPGVGDKLRKKIIRQANQKGFYPSGAARSLATSKTETVALVFCDEASEFLTNPFYSEVLAGIAAETTHREFSLAFCSLSSGDYRRSQQLPKIMRERRADGFLFVGDQDDSLIRHAQRLDFPLVLVDHRLESGKFDTVAINNRTGGRQAVEHLIGLGHRRIGFVGGSLRSPSFQERMEGYAEALQAHGIAFEKELVQLGESHAGYENTLRLLSTPKPPTAIFACNDFNAVRAMKAIHEHGLRIPDDVSIVGFDDSRCATEAWPRLTTLRIDAQYMGRRAVEILLARIAQKSKAFEQVFIEPELIVRDSCVSPKKADTAKNLG